LPTPLDERGDAAAFEGAHRLNARYLNARHRRVFRPMPDTPAKWPLGSARQATCSRSKLKYRPDIDGLRAIAVLFVIGFHAFPRLLPGGYIGVDIFFVISGFLITGLILHELEAKEFSFQDFYARRVRRIFPALAAVLAACFCAGWLLLLPDEFKSLGWNILGGAAFSSNFVLLNQSGYFDLSAGQKPCYTFGPWGWRNNSTLFGYC
jgi:peptidoglycan/LPS O-acetylase OafA/YrhL